jgi:Tfp pilus assembly protein PilF
VQQRQKHTPKHTPHILACTAPNAAPADGPNQPPQVWLDLIGHSYLERRLTKEAIGVFQMNVEAYPKSASAHRSLGCAYERCGEIELAARSFQRASELFIT